MTLKRFYKFKKNLTLIAAAWALSLFCGLPARAQEIEAKIKITSAAPAARVHIEGKFLNPKDILAGKDVAFLQNYADATGLGERIENLNLFDEAGKKLEVKKLIAGEYRANERAIFFRV